MVARQGRRSLLNCRCNLGHSDRALAQGPGSESLQHLSNNIRTAGDFFRQLRSRLQQQLTRTSLAKTLRTRTASTSPIMISAMMERRIAHTKS